MFDIEKNNNVWHDWQLKRKCERQLNQMITILAISDSSCVKVFYFIFCLDAGRRHATADHPRDVPLGV